MIELNDERKLTLFETLGIRLATGLTHRRVHEEAIFGRWSAHGISP